MKKVIKVRMHYWPIMIRLLLDIRLQIGFLGAFFDNRVNGWTDRIWCVKRRRIFWGEIWRKSSEWEIVGDIFNVQKVRWTLAVKVKTISMNRRDGEEKGEKKGRKGRRGSKSEKRGKKGFSEAGDELKEFERNFG